MLPCCAHAEKRPEVYILDVKMAGEVLSAISSLKALNQVTFEAVHMNLSHKKDCVKSLGICPTSID